MGRIEMARSVARSLPLAVLAWIVSDAVSVTLPPLQYDSSAPAAAVVLRAPRDPMRWGPAAPGARGVVLRGADSARLLDVRGGGEASMEKKGFLGRTEIRLVLETGAAGIGEEVVVCGWARTVRVQGAGAFAFLEINDGSSFHGSVPHPVSLSLGGWSGPGGRLGLEP